MPALEDYLAARCLLLNNIFTGLTLAHEAVEKLMKSLLILENIKFPKRCHNLPKLENLLFTGDAQKYKFLNDNFKFIHRLDEHYGWRYYDDISKRSRSKSPTELHPVDTLFIKLYECYMDFLPTESKFGSYLLGYLFAPAIREHTSWPHWLLADNRALKSRVANWEKKFMEWHTDKLSA